MKIVFWYPSVFNWSLCILNKSNWLIIFWILDKYILSIIGVCTTWTLTKRMEKKQLHKNAASNIEQVLEAASYKAAAVRPITIHLENYLN